MRDKLPRKPWYHEKGIINMDLSSGPGTHWVAYKKTGNLVNYFDSYGNLSPLPEIVDYFRGSRIIYNYKNYQKRNLFNCGHLCLRFLMEKL